MDLLRLAYRPQKVQDFVDESNNAECMIVPAPTGVKVMLNGVHIGFVSPSHGHYTRCTLKVFLNDNPWLASDCILINFL